jgi:hypothetical protein
MTLVKNGHGRNLGRWHDCGTHHGAPLSDFQNRHTWGVLQDSAVATGAFPVGLAPQVLEAIANTL